MNNSESTPTPIAARLRRRFQAGHGTLARLHPNPRPSGFQPPRSRTGAAHGTPQRASLLCQLHLGGPPAGRCNADGQVKILIALCSSRWCPAPRAFLPRAFGRQPVALASFRIGPHPKPFT